MAVDQGLIKRDGIVKTTAIPPYRFVVVDALGYDYIKLAGANGKVLGVGPAGIHDQDGTTNAGDLDDQMEYYAGGRVKIELGGTVAVGDFVKSDANGKAVVIAAGAGSQYVGGQAIVGGASGDVGQIEIMLFEHGGT